MHKGHRTVVLLACAAACSHAAAPTPHTRVASRSAALAYPPATRSSVVDTLHGMKVADPYRWLEEDTPQTRAWVAAENALTDTTLAAIDGRAHLRERLGAVYQVERNSMPVLRRGHAYWMQRQGGAEHPRLLGAPSLDAPAAVLLDLATRAGQGDVFADWSVSSDGALAAYGFLERGGDWTHWHLFDLKTQRDLPEVLAHAKYYPPAIAPGGRVYYGRFPAPSAGEEILARDEHHQLMMHRIGTPVADDVVVYARPDQPSWQFSPLVTDDGRYLVISIGDGQVGDRSEEQIALLDLTRPNATPTLLVDRFEAEFIPIGSVDHTLYFLSSLGAPNRKVIAIDARAPARQHWKTVVAEGTAPISDVRLAGRQLIVTSLVHAHSQASAYALDGSKQRDIEAPALGTLTWGDTSDDAREAMYALTSFTTPRSVYRYDLQTGASRLWKAPAARLGPDPLETTQVFYPSRDGTRVPMFIVARKGLVRDGSAPTILSAYGFGGVPNLPRFSPLLVPWLERGGIFAVANVRGGGEYGEAWHHAARGRKRQTGIDDFIAAAEWLVAERYTSSARLGATGSSGGGMMVAMTMVQRPTLFSAVVPVVGVYDLLRFARFGQGAGWQGDLGSPDDPEDARVLRALSPLHNVRAGIAYPATFLVTSDHDVRVAPLHSYKFAAALQAAQAGPAPVLLRVYKDAGHDGGSPAHAITESEELVAFFAHHLGLRLDD